MIENITNQGTLLAIIIRHSFHEPGVHFLTPDDEYLQVAHMGHPQGKIIQPHLHNEIRREIARTQEVLIIKKGKLRVDFFDHNKLYLDSRFLEENDILFLASGGHGFEAIEDLEMIEVKQGPYLGEHEKIKFSQNLE